MAKKSTSKSRKKDQRIVETKTRAGRPRINEQTDEAERYPANLSTEDRDLMTQICEYYNLRNDVDGVRVAIKELDRNRTAIGREISRKPEVIAGDNLKPFHMWITPDERKVLESLRDYFSLKTDADVVRLAIRQLAATL